MPKEIFTEISEYLEKIKNIENREELKELNNEYLHLFEGGEVSSEFEKIRTRMYAIVSELVVLREERNKKFVRSSTELSEAEHSEILSVQKLIDFNLFTYHFQPIVRVDNGEIYSYEALMRARDMKGITPFHILKYAEMTDRLGEVEQYTFLNVLNYIKDNRELFEGKLVFINSMPNVHINPEKSEEIGRMLDLLSDSVVVEMTENSEYNEEELNEIKEKYRGLNIRIAIDDYGTGYSNISNLLRYTPNYVKIDRTLLSGIQNNPNKKHFVREIIDFCHENNILALAEGVENSDELRTVILLGVDLIQGFYTARPTAEVIQAIPYEIRAEIRSYKQEREDGKRMKIYTAEKGERVSLDKLLKDNFTVIRVGTGFSDGAVTVSGSPYIETNMHIEINDGYSGKLILDSARLSNSYDRPCIDIGENSSVTIDLVGNSILENSGIKVPSSSTVHFEGNGNVDIKLGSHDYYGIGNDNNSAHGDLIFEQDGTIEITSDSHAGVCIGSGMGGKIDVKRGRYVLKALGSMSVCFGSIDGRTEISLAGCDIHAEASGAHCTAIGSLNSDAEISISYSGVKCNVGGILAAGIGTVLGEHVFINVESSNVIMEMRAEGAVVFGSMYKDSVIQMQRASASADAEGDKVLIFGGHNGGTELKLAAFDLSARMRSQMTTCYIPGSKKPDIDGGRFRININGTDYYELQ